MPLAPQVLAQQSTATRDDHLSWVGCQPVAPHTPSSWVLILRTPYTTRSGDMHDPATQLLRIPLPRTPVNKDKKQLSWMSRGKVLRRPPRGAVFEDSVEDRQELAHAGYQSHLLRFAGRQKTLVEFLHYRVATRGDQGAHIQRGSDLGSTSPHATMAAQSARVAVERSEPHQGGHSLVRERAQLGHSGQQGPSQHRAHSWHAAQQRLVLAKGWPALDFTTASKIQGPRLQIGPGPM